MLQATTDDGKLGSILEKMPEKWRLLLLVLLLLLLVSCGCWPNCCNYHQFQ